MPKRVNRLNAINHEINQLDMIKELQPNTSPEEARELSNLLIQIAQEALREVGTLETGRHPELIRLGRLFELVDNLPESIKT